MALDKNFEIFVVHIAALKVSIVMLIHPLRTSQIQGLDKPILAVLQWDKAPIKISSKYTDYINVFSLDLAIELLENMEMNKHAIELIDGKQPLYGPIYTLSPVELETLKTYIKIHLKTRFIWPSKFPTSASILFNKKPNDSLRLCINYQGLNNLMIKNWYPLPLIGKFLDQLGRAKRFTQRDLTNTYHWMRIWEDDD